MTLTMRPNTPEHLSLESLSNLVYYLRLKGLHSGKLNTCRWKNVLAYFKEKRFNTLRLCPQQAFPTWSNILR
jgi:hypothetical protein